MTAAMRLLEAMLSLFCQRQCQLSTTAARQEHHDGHRVFTVAALVLEHGRIWVHHDGNQPYTYIKAVVVLYYDRLAVCACQQGGLGASSRLSQLPSKACTGFWLRKVWRSRCNHSDSFGAEQGWHVPHHEPTPCWQ